MLRKIEISHKTIIFTVFFLIFLGFLFIIRDIILVMFVALLIMAILNPLVTKLSRFRIPRGVSVFVVYLLVIGILGIAIGAIVPPLIEQTTSFVNGLPSYLANLGVPGNISDQLVAQGLSQLGTIPAQIAKFTVSLLSNVLGIITVLIFAFYLLLARERLQGQLGFLVGDSKEKELGKTIDLLEEKMGGWARGQLSLMLMVGLTSYIGLTLLGIPFALPLAILAGILEIVPYIGPILAAIPAIVIGLGISPFVGLAVAALALLIQQLESYLFVPKVMEKSAGVSPIVTLLSLAIGFRIAGVVGVIISVPVVIAVSVLSKQYFRASK